MAKEHCFCLETGGQGWKKAGRVEGRVEGRQDGQWKTRVKKGRQGGRKAGRVDRVEGQGGRQARHTRNLWLSCPCNGDKSEFGDELFKIYFILLVSPYLIFVTGTIDSNFCVLLHMGIHDICRRHCLWSKKIMWGKIAPREKITNYSTFVMWSNLSLLHMTKLPHMINLQFMLSCRNLRSFYAMSIVHFVTFYTLLWRKN